MYSSMYMYVYFPYIVSGLSSDSRKNDIYEIFFDNVTLKKSDIDIRRNYLFYKASLIHSMIYHN